MESTPEDTLDPTGPAAEAGADAGAEAGTDTAAEPVQADGQVHPRSPTPVEPKPPRRSWAPSNLTLRLLTAAVLIPPVIWVCYEGGLTFVAVIIAINCVAVNEFYNFISEKGANPQRLLGTLGVAVIPLIIYLGDAFLATSFLTAVLLTTMVLQLTKREMREAISSVSATFFGVFYVGWLLSHAVSIRFIYDFLVRRYPGQAESLIAPEVGFFFMILCLVSALGCDVAAYFVGRAFGRHRLAPVISPSKSVEGAIGGVVIAGGFGVVTKLVFDNFVPGHLSAHFGIGAAAAFGVALAAVGILGDLVESALKRDAQLKDAGRLLPGVGGVLDRIDSALLAFPVMYYLLLAYYYFRFST
ncbi:MAG: phosphatidate cytidylyltransferase [Deltaproteobacteria bacterium]|nr:phosphatidate cytidylyltransferase [Deltaproteobacteria bacterium]MBW2413977.1 phosphatidate cytidylyltransferase [Deltaproteobacteria bacterium]